MTKLRTLASVALIAAAAVSVTACVSAYGPGYGPNDYGPYAHGATFAYPYYDGSYGYVDTGYWGDDGAFMYRGTDQQFHRDDSGHFRRDRAQGYHRVQTHAAHPDAARASADHG